MTYTEDLLIEQPAINLFGEMGWETAICWDESFGVDSTFGRDNRSNVILYQPLKDAICKLNPMRLSENRLPYCGDSKLV